MVQYGIIQVTYDISAKTGFIVHKADSTNHVNTPFKKGHFFSDEVTLLLSQHS